ncbi:hypothetical protein DL93DRAFT_2230449 [Clavulina sp. PMI_390]|nr:hypothetical protein DL93DRAFT_2230449 [Clavulina sp. PMI_390]
MLSSRAISFFTLVLGSFSLVANSHPIAEVNGHAARAVGYGGGYGGDSGSGNGGNAVTTTCTSSSTAYNGGAPAPTPTTSAVPTTSAAPTPIVYNGGNNGGNNGGKTGVSNGGGSCGYAGCNEQNMANILTKLQSDINVHIGYFDGHQNPISHGNSIASLVKQATKDVLALDVNTSGQLGSLASTQIAPQISTILKGTIGGCGKYSSGTGLLFGYLGQLTGTLDGTLANFVNACSQRSPGLVPVVSKQLVGVSWHNLGFTLSSSSCGLKY